MFIRNGMVELKNDECLTNHWFDPLLSSNAWRRKYLNDSYVIQK